MTENTRREQEPEDPFLDWVLNALQYIKDRSQLFIGGAVAVVAVLAIAHFVQGQRDAAREDAAQAIFQMMLADNQGQVNEAIAAGEELISTFAGTPSAGQGMIMLANRYFQIGRYEEAQQLYERYISEYGDAEALLFSAHTGIAACHEARGDLQQAATAYVAYADQHPDQKASAMALMDAARCYRLLGDDMQRQALLERVSEDFPSTAVAQRARQELQLL